MKSSKPEPAIFWQFIEQDRNIILKEYRFRMEHLPEVLLAQDDGSLLLLDDGSAIRLSNGLTFTEGPFEGWTPLDLCTQAIAWWDKQIDLLESRITAASG